MDSQIARSREQSLVAAKKRLQSFRTKQAQNVPPVPQHTHARSHSRSNSSISAAIPQIPKSASEPANLAAATRSRPNSSHKRNSSVSTRRESAELMGIIVPAEDRDASKEADPIRKALLALEGNHGAANRNTFTHRTPKVLIPDLDELESREVRKPFALNNSLAGKRDSFGKLLAPASSSKLELHTLMEEEEEEEIIAPAPVKLTPVVTPPKPRPQNLTLYPSSLSMQAFAAQSLPSPSPTPSPRIPGLKSLTLMASPPSSYGSPSPSSFVTRRAASPLSPLPCATPVRKSSISYKKSTDTSVHRPLSPKGAAQRSFTDQILTPEPTPTTPSPPESLPDLSPSRKAFIYQSHSALVSRVADLERLLAARSVPRHAHQGSPLSSSGANDEFLALIADVKAERDELKRDVEGWRVRVADLEKQAVTLSNRIETERKQGWVVREQLGVLEIEKAGIERDGHKLKATIEQLNDHVASLQWELDQARKENTKLQREVAVIKPAQQPALNLKFAGRAQKGLSFMSMDSLGSATDVEDVTSSQRSSLAAGLATVFKLKAVEEERDHFSGIPMFDQDEDEYGARELARYEDEDSEGSFYSPSRPDSQASIRASPVSPLNVVKNSPSPSPSPTHQRKSSLTKTWTFAAATGGPASSQSAEVDKFFLCLEDADEQLDEDSEPEDATLTRPKLGLGFGHGFGYGRADDDDDEDDLPPFVLPVQPTDKLAKLGMALEEGAGSVLGFRFPATPKAKAAPQFVVGSPIRRANSPSSRTPAPVPRDTHRSASGCPASASLALVNAGKAVPFAFPPRVAGAQHAPAPFHAQPPNITPIIVPMPLSSPATTATPSQSLPARIRIPRRTHTRPFDSSLSTTGSSLSSLGPRSPSSPTFAARMSSLTTILAAPWSPSAAAAPVSREKQLARLRSELSHCVTSEACAQCRDSLLIQL